MASRVHRTAAQSGSSTPAPASGTAQWIKYNLNTITTDQILPIPNAGDQMTHEFAEYRPYTSIGQFRQEIGKYVDDSVVSGYEQYVFVAVPLADADADTIAQLPGVTSDIADDLASQGPFADAEAFLAAVGEKVSSDFAALASGYLAS